MFSPREWVKSIKELPQTIKELPQQIKSLPQELLLFAFLGFVFLFLYPFFVNEYWIHVMIIVFYYLVAAASWNLLFGYTGLFSFAHAAMGSLGAYSGALFALNFGIHPIPSIFIGALVAAGVSYLIGRLTPKLRSLFLSFITLAFAEGFRLIIVLEYEITGGLNGLRVPFALGTVRSFPYYFLFMAVAVVSLIILYKLVKSRIGLYLRTIREDEIAAAVLGVDVTKWKIFSFTVSGFFMGLAGAFLGFYLGILDPTRITWTEMGVIMSMVIIGGAGTFVGPLIGVPLIELLSELLRDFGVFRMLLYGILMIVVMRISKEGIYGVIHKRMKSVDTTVRPQLHLEQEAETIID
jgi:branched-chain amino acid transport system permease protein